VISIAGVSARCLISLGSSTVLAARSYSREQSSPLYTVNTTSKAVEVGCSAAGRAAIVKSGSAAARQQGIGSAISEAAEVG
jgi:hypothetical protein